MDISQESAGQLNPQQAEIVEDLMNSFNGENLTELSPLDARRPIHAILENWEAQVGEIDRRDVARRSLPMWRQVFDRARAVDDAVAKVTEVIDDSKDALTARRNALTELKSTVDYAKVQKSLERFKENPTHNVEARDVKKRMFQKIEKFLKDNPEQVQGMLKVLNGIDSGTNEAVSEVQNDIKLLGLQNEQLREQNAQYASSLENFARLQTEQAAKLDSIETEIEQMQDIVDERLEEFVSRTKTFDRKLREQRVDIRSGQDKVSNLEKEVQTLRLSEQDARSEVAGMVKAREELQRQVSGLESSVERLENENVSHKAEKETVERELRAKEMEVNELRQKVVDHREERREMNAQVEEYVKLLEASSKSVNLQLGISTVLNKENTDLKRELGVSKTSRTILTQDLEKAKEENEAKSLQCQQLEERVAELENQDSDLIQQLRNEKTVLNEGNGQLTEMLDGVKAIFDPQGKFPDVLSAATQARQNMSKVRNAYESLKNSANRIPMLDAVFHASFEGICKFYGFQISDIEDAWIVTAKFREALNTGNVQACAQNYHEIHDFAPKACPVMEGSYESFILFGYPSMGGKRDESCWVQAMLLSGRAGTNRYKVSVAEIQDIGDSLRNAAPDSIRLTMIFLYAFVTKRIHLLKTGQKAPSIASGFTLLRVIELLVSHVTGAETTFFLHAVFAKTAALHSMSEPAIQTLTEALRARLWDEAPVTVLGVQCRIQKPFADAGDYLITKQTDCLLVFKKSTDQMALVRPSFFSWNVDIEGWQVVFDNAPLVGSWATPFWDIDQVDMISEIFEGMFDEASQVRVSDGCIFDDLLVDGQCP